MLKSWGFLTRCDKRASARRLAGRPIRRRRSRGLRSLRGRSPNAARINYFRPYVERLEERRVLAAVVVDLGALAGAADLVDVAVTSNGYVAVANVDATATTDHGAELLTFDASFNLVNVQPLVGLGGPTYVTALSSNGEWIAGRSVAPDSVGGGEGVVWSASDPANPIGVGFSGTYHQSPALDVNNAGVAVGDDDDGRLPPYRWDAANGLTDLGTSSIGFAKGITDDGSVIVGQNTNSLANVLRLGTGPPRGFTFLSDPNQIGSIARRCLANGRIHRRRGRLLQSSTFTFGEQAAVWDSSGQLNLLTDVNGDPFQGRVLGVTDHGWAVGRTSDNQGFIYDPNLGYAELFNTWLADQGVTLPDPSASVNAVVEDPVHGQLLFADTGSSFFVGVDMPGIGGPPQQPTIVGTDGADSYNLTITQDEWLTTLGGNDNVNATITTAGVNVIVDLGEGNNHANLTIAAADVILDVRGGEGNNTVVVNLQGAQGAQTSITLHGGRDVVRTFVRSSPNVTITGDLGNGTNTFFAGVWGSDGASLGACGGDGRDTFIADLWSSNDARIRADLGDGNNMSAVNLWNSSDASIAIRTGDGQDHNSLFADRADGLSYTGTFGGGNDHFQAFLFRTDDSDLQVSLGAGADRFWASYFQSDNAHVLVDAGQEHDRLFLDFLRSTGAEFDAYYGRHGRFIEWDWLSDPATHRHLGQSSNASFAEQVFADDAAIGNLLLGL